MDNQRERGGFGDFLREGDRGIAKIVRLRDCVAQAPCERLFTFDAAPRVEHQAGFLHTDQTRERVGQAEAGMDAYLDEVSGEASLDGRDAEVGDQRKSESAADCGALDCGDDGLFASEQSHAFDVERILTSARWRLAAAGVAIGKVGARAK